DPTAGRRRRRPAARSSRPRRPCRPGGAWRRARPANWSRREPAPRPGGRNEGDRSGWAGLSSCSEPSGGPTSGHEYRLPTGRGSVPPGSVQVEIGEDVGQLTGRQLTLGVPPGHRPVQQVEQPERQVLGGDILAQGAGPLGLRDRLEDELLVLVPGG